MSLLPGKNSFRKPKPPLTILRNAGYMLDDYVATGLFTNGHFNTLFTHFFGKARLLPFVREPLLHPAGFNLYLDWVKQGNDRLVIFSHGLESSSHARYIQSLGRSMLASGYDVLAWNLRNCAKGETWQKNAHYHSGISEDLDLIIGHVLATQHYKQIVLVGFSMGGNIMLKYLGEKGQNLPGEIKSAAAISTPLDLLSCSHALLQFPNMVYGRHFLKTILHKVRMQRENVEALGLDVEQLLQTDNLRDFDHLFTAKVHGFNSQDHYYTSASAKPLLGKIAIPTLLLNACDDPILTPECFPSAEEINNPLITLLYTQHGGHVGFYTPAKAGTSWLENKVKRFLLGQET